MLQVITPEQTMPVSSLQGVEEEELGPLSTTTVANKETSKAAQEQRPPVNVTAQNAAQNLHQEQERREMQTQSDTHIEDNGIDHRSVKSDNGILEVDIDLGDLTDEALEQAPPCRGELGSDCNSKKYCDEPHKPFGEAGKQAVPKSEAAERKKRFAFVPRKSPGVVVQKENMPGLDLLETGLWSP